MYVGIVYARVRAFDLKVCVGVIYDMMLFTDGILFIIVFRTLKKWRIKDKD